MTLQSKGSTSRWCTYNVVLLSKEVVLIFLPKIFFLPLEQKGTFFLFFTLIFHSCPESLFPSSNSIPILIFSFLCQSDPYFANFKNLPFYYFTKIYLRFPSIVCALTQQPNSGRGLSNLGLDNSLQTHRNKSGLAT